MRFDVDDILFRCLAGRWLKPNALGGNVAEMLQNVRHGVVGWRSDRGRGHGLSLLNGAHQDFLRGWGLGDMWMIPDREAWQKPTLLGVLVVVVKVECQARAVGQVALYIQERKPLRRKD